MNRVNVERLYADVPDKQKRIFWEYRQAHPYKERLINGTNWRYVACGRGEKALLFLPGAFSTADMWFYTIRQLERTYRIIAPDTFALQGVFDMDDICRALLAILRAEGVDKVTVIGLSAGGGVAQYLLQEYPQHVEHVVLSHTGVYGAAGARAIRPLSLLLAILPGWSVKRLLAKRLGGEYPQSSLWAVFTRAFYKELMAGLSKATLRNFLNAAGNAGDFVFDPDVIQAWPGSMLILSSCDDAVTYDKLDRLHARYPGAKMHIFKEGGHHTFMLFPEAYTAILEAFLVQAYW